MNRRDFLGRSSIGLAGAILFPTINLSLTTKWNEPGYYGPLTAQQFMALAWNTHIKGTGAGHWPKFMTASPALFDHYESGLTSAQRFSSNVPDNGWPHHLMFKSAELYRWEPSGSEHPNVGDRSWALVIPMIPKQNKIYYVSDFGWKV